MKTLWRIITYNWALTVAFIVSWAVVLGLVDPAKALPASGTVLVRTVTSLVILALYVLGPAILVAGIVAAVMLIIKRIR